MSARLSTPPKRYETSEGQKWAEDVRREVNNMLFFPYTSTAVDISINSSHKVVETTAAIVVTLPSAVGLTGRTYSIDNSSSGNTTIIDEDGALVGGSTIYTLGAGLSVSVYSNGSNWRVL